MRVFDHGASAVAKSGPGHTGVVLRQYVVRLANDVSPKNSVLLRNLVIDARVESVGAEKVARVREEISEIVAQSISAGLVGRGNIGAEHLQRRGIQPACWHDIARERVAGSWILDGDGRAQREELGEIPLPHGRG